MNSVERVRAICKDRKIPISKLEKDLGFSNGYIRQLRKGVFPADRLELIAQYLGVTPGYLMTGKITAPEQDKITHQELKFALWGECNDMDEEDLADVLKYAAFVRARKSKQ